MRVVAVALAAAVSMSAGVGLVSNIMKTKHDAAKNALVSVGRPQLQQEEEQRYRSVLKTRHDTAKNSVGNIR